VAVGAHRNADAWPLPNVWLGVSVENQHFADERIPLLLQTPAAVRFISAEPLLGPVGSHAAFSRVRSGHTGDVGLPDIAHGIRRRERTQRVAISIG
jgi:protein gp37